MHHRAVALAVVASVGVVAASAGVAAGPTLAVAPATGDSASRASPDLPEQWQGSYGDEGDDAFADLVRTDDGGYLAVGWTEREGSDDGWLVAVDADGDRRWSRTLGGDGTDRLYAAVPTDDGYLLAGRTDEGGTPNGWVVAVDSAGEVVRERALGPGAVRTAVRADATRADPTDRAGANSSGDATDQPGDAGYLLAGYTYGDAGTEGWLLKLDADRDESWRTGVSPPEGYDGGTLRAVVPADSGYYLAGKIEGDSDDGWALKVGGSGEREWATVVGGTDREDVWAAAPAGPDPERDGFVLAGETESDSDGPRDGWLVALGPDGDVAWERSPGGEGTQWLDSAARTDDGFLFTGGSDAGPHGSADGYVLATDAGGRVESERYYGTSAWDKPWPAVRAHGGGYLLAGETAGGDAGGDDGWLLRIGGSAGDGASEATDAGVSSEGTAGATSTGTGAVDSATTDATDRAVRADTPTATDASGGVPGFGVGAAFLALAAALLAARR
ncbi:hypothetical protein [Halorussus halobius]|uniref:hypothetical protein n=1 Tax=Halorussus halobius TaxID=1710537 RepID=UPI001092B730|nr:hypothetical protein [Halorussus halobius]